MLGGRIFCCTGFNVGPCSPFALCSVPPRNPRWRKKKGPIHFGAYFILGDKTVFINTVNTSVLISLDFQQSNPSGALGISAIVKAVEHLPARFVPFTGRRMWQIHLLRDRPMVMAQDRAILVNIKIAGKCIFIHQKKWYKYVCFK